MTRYEILGKAAWAISHPLVLQGAWLRVDGWYRSGGLAPQRELSCWRLHPEEQLRKLSAQMRGEGWVPQIWPQVPYPKKNARLRHYVVPSVRDQVAFMAHMVLLGPILDGQVSNFAFGNRWYRPVVWNRRKKSPSWELRPYPFKTDKIYLPYARSYGLFRRVAHWTVGRMTDARIRTQDAGGRVQHVKDYADDVLPPWTRAEWWIGSDGRKQAFWAALDIELAYPSIQLDRLESDMREMLEGASEVSSLEIQGCPEDIFEILHEEKVRVDIGRSLVRALRQVEVDTGGIPRRAWGPPDGHRMPRVAPEKDLGLPTGLAISGALLNVALHSADEAVKTFLERTTGERRGAIVRFADDIYVFSRSIEGVLDLIEAVHVALSGNLGGSLATSNDVSNISLNFNKIRPKPTRDVVATFLEENGWKKCDGCGQPLPPAPSQHRFEGFSEWWAGRLTNKTLDSNLREELERTGIGPGDVGLFVTTLVERLSDLGTDTLRERFGQGARDQLSRLHELARFDIDDEQVRAESRRAFSVNRLVRAWLPSGMKAGAVHEIRETVAFVLRCTPWKLGLWRAVVRAAARRSDDVKEEQGHVEARNWLSGQLCRIAVAHDNGDREAWFNIWPEESISTQHEVDGSWRDLYLSIHRASFWRALSDVLRDLARHDARNAGCNAELDGPSPNDWAVRAVPAGLHRSVADSLGALDEWVKVLYPAGGEFDLNNWSWELDEFVGAVLSAHTTTALVDAFRRTGDPRNEFMVSRGTDLSSLPKCKEILERFGRIAGIVGRRNQKLNLGALAHVWLGQTDSGLSRVLFPGDRLPRIGRSMAKPEMAVSAGLALSCFENIPIALARRLVPNADRRTEIFERDPLRLTEYGRTRRIIVGQEVIQTVKPTLHRLLWGTPSEGNLEDWCVRGWETPALGLPILVANKLFGLARTKPLPSDWSILRGPLNWVIDDSAGAMVSARRSQFGIDLSVDQEASIPKNNIIDPAINVAKSTEWEVLPHEALYLPFVNVESFRVHAESYVIYCDVLLLLTALDGSERILDELARWGAGSIPFEDRWNWRSRIHLPRDGWRCLEKILRWSEYPGRDVTAYGRKLVESLRVAPLEPISYRDFFTERIDVDLSLRYDLEAVRSIDAASVFGAVLPDELNVDAKQLADRLLVRIGQVTEWPKSSDIVQQFPSIPWNTTQAIMEQVTNVFLSSASERPNLVLLPEVLIPRHEVGTVRQLVRQTGISSLAGLYWRVLPPPFRPAGTVTASWKCFVNEVELVVPVGYDDYGPTSVRWFRVQKLRPSYLEVGLAKVLTKRDRNTSWSILKGDRWFRFVHDTWGDFTIAICADLIDPVPWRSLRGELLHLFMVAFNKDIDLFDSMTWVRAYENYVNVACVNHGSMGGSVLWTPKRSHGREIARLHGQTLYLTVDTKLPIGKLLEQQLHGVENAIGSAAKQWDNKQEPQAEFKSPPPGFVRRAVRQ